MFLRVLWRFCNFPAQNGSRKSNSPASLFELTPVHFLHRCTYDSSSTFSTWLATNFTLIGLKANAHPTNNNLNKNCNAFLAISASLSTSSRAPLVSRLYDNRPEPRNCGFLVRRTECACFHPCRFVAAFQVAAFADDGTFQPPRDTAFNECK